MQSAFDSVPRERIWEAMEYLQVDKDLCEQVRASHEGDYISVEGVPHISAATTGIKQGDPYGTNIWNIVMKLWLGRIHNELEMEGLLVETVRTHKETCLTCDDGYEGGAEESSIVYTDDCAFMVDTWECGQIWERLSTVISIVNRVFVAAGLWVNYATGKSEAMVSL